MIRASLVAMLTLTLPSTLSAQVVRWDTTGKFAGSYLCIGEAAGGVAYDKEQKRWTGTSFKAEEKYVMKIKWDKRFTGSATKKPALAYSIEIEPFGQTHSNKSCVKWGNPTGKPETFPINRDGFIYCDQLFHSWSFNLKNGRFMQHYRLGYISGQDNNDNTPYIQVGRCSRIN